MTVWRSYGQARPPDVVVVSSMLWDLARMHFFEPELVEGQDLGLDVLQAWVRNFTTVVEYAKRALPQVSRHTLFDTHTLMVSYPVPRAQGRLPQSTPFGRTLSSFIHTQARSALSSSSPTKWYTAGGAVCLSHGDDSEV